MVKCLFNQRPSFPSVAKANSNRSPTSWCQISDKMKALIRQKEAGKINLGPSSLLGGAREAKSDRKMKICNYGDEGWME